MENKENAVAEMQVEFEKIKGVKISLIDSRNRMEEKYLDAVQRTVELEEICEKKNIEIEEYEGKIDALNSTLHSSHDMNQKMLIQIKRMKDYIESLKKSSAIVVEENEKLKMTMGSDFYNLTPRPNWTNLSSDLKFGLVDGNT